LFATVPEFVATVAVGEDKGMTMSSRIAETAVCPILKGVEVSALTGV